jgi:hypothetical protein
MEEIFSVNCSSNDEENVQEELSELENIVESPEDQNDSYTNFAASALTYWANEFDQGILAKAYAVPRAENEEEAEGDSRNGNIWIGTAKNYKDYTWEKKAQSSDPPLKVIRGKLIGPTGIINAVAEYYLWLNHHTVWENYNEFRRNEKRTKSKQEKIKTIKVESLNEPLPGSHGDDNENARTRIDVLSSKALKFCSDSPEMKRREQEEMLKMFTNWELAFLLARAADLQTAEFTEDFLQAGHTKISNYWNNTLRKKAYSVRDLLFTRNGFSLIKKRIEAEKGSELFLSEVKKAFEQKGIGGLL